MFTECVKEFDLNLLKTNHAFESALDVFNIESSDIQHLFDNGYFGESGDECLEMFEAAEKTLKERIKDFFAAIRKAIKDFIEKIKTAIETEKAKNEMKKTLDSYVKLLASNKVFEQQAKGKKIKRKKMLIL